jgi:hypothetical protein
MEKVGAIILFLFFIPLATTLSGQSPLLDNRRFKQIPTQPDTLTIDSLPLSPASIQLENQSGPLPSSACSFKVYYNQLIWITPPPGDSVWIRYRVLSFPHASAWRLRDSSRIRPSANTDYIGFDYTPYTSSGRGSLFDQEGLNYSGSFTRGLSFGNNQNLVLNSSLNLQLNGMLGDDIEVLAAISDNNIPIQPEGNTRQLQEFDKIFIQLRRRNNSLLAGDYELGRPTGYFLNYFKKLQGATLTNTQVLADSSRLTTTASAAITRGKFARNLIPGEEGNQGPYRLRGTNDELFIIVLAGTEKIYIDGELLQRGIEYDYTIDYNRGDITFTNKRLITKDIRIIAEFEYTDQQYLRSLYALNTAWEHSRGNFYLNLYSEQDNKNSGQAQDLSTEQRQALREAGDASDGILVSGVRSSEGSLNPIQYISIPNPYFPLGDSILVPIQLLEGELLCELSSDLEDLARLRLQQAPRQLAVSFSQVTQGQGFYRRCSEAFGTVFVYSPPDSVGNLTGDYLPLIRLTPPQQRQMYSLGGSYQVAKEGKLTAEISMSNTDLNRFSREGKADDRGMAIRSDYQQNFSLGSSDSSWMLETTLFYEGVQQNFLPLNPYRNAEFSRDWLLENSEQVNTAASEQIAGGGFRLKKEKTGSLAYQFSTFSRDSLFKGLRHTYDLKTRFGGMDVKIYGTETQTNSIREKGRFSRPRFQFAYLIPKSGDLELGVYGEREKSVRRAVEADTLLNSSFHYDLARAFLRNGKEAAVQFETSFTRRWDFLPAGNQFAEATEADILNVNGSWQGNSAFTLSWNFNYRDLRIEAPELTEQRGQRTYLGRLDYALTLWRGGLRSNTSYELGSGQEQKVEFVYQQLDPGVQGTHFWNDLNDDGLIQVAEVELPPFPEAANLIRIPQLTGEFFRTDNVQFNQSLWLEPRLLSRGNSFWSKVLQKISLQSAVRILRKTGASEQVQVWNPFQLALADSLLISANTGMQHVLYFNRVSPVWDVQLSWQDSRSQLTLGTGPEGRTRREYSISGRWNFHRQWSTRLRLLNEESGRSLGNSEQQTGVDFLIRSLALEPQLTWQTQQNFRTSLTYQFRRGKNQEMPGGEETKQSHFTLESVYNQNIKTALRINLSLVQVQFDGEINSPVSFAMLNGLQPGRNYIWNFSLDRQLANNILLNLTYEGRQTGEAAVVHIGRAQLRANF